MTKKQKLFLMHYAQCRNPAEAAKLAGYHARSDTAFQKVGSDLLKRLYANSNDTASVADEDEVLRFFSNIMRRSCQDTNLVMRSLDEAYYEPDEKGTMRKKSRKVRNPEIIQTPVKLSDACKAAELLGKHYALFNDHSGKNYFGGDSEETININLTDEEQE